MATTRRLRTSRNEKGIVLVYVAIVIFVLFGMAGLAVDAGHLYVVRGELQNAADAAALAGAYSLYRDPENPGILPLDWDRAREAAEGFISQNKTGGVALSTGNVEAGYWPPVDPNLPLSTVMTSADQKPAVRVTVSRSAGVNGGPVELFFMKVLNSANVSAPVSSRPAVAMSGPVGAVAPTTLFPMALSKCMTDDIFSKPEEEWPNPININSPYGPGGADCFSGQWTSFKTDLNSVDAIRDLMENGNPDSLSIGDEIWIEPGEEATLYQADKWTPPLPPEGIDVVMAIVDSEATPLNVKGERIITGFATFHIDGTVATGSDKHIFGHFVSYSETYPAGSSIGGTPTNIVTPPLMVQ